jgi:hypothetical protein
MVSIYIYFVAFFFFIFVSSESFPILHYSSSLNACLLLYSIL